MLLSSNSNSDGDSNGTTTAEIRQLIDWKIGALCVGVRDDFDGK